MLICKKYYKEKFDENLMKRFFDRYKCSNHDINMFVLLLHKGVDPYKYVNDWEKVNETLLAEKEDFYSHLNMEDITDADYMHRKFVKIFK